MKKIMFNDKYGLTQSVLSGQKTMTRRFVKEGTPLGNWSETEKYLTYKVGEIVAIAQSYKDIYAEKIADFAKHNYHIPREDAAEKFRKLHETCAGWNNKMFVGANLMEHHIIITDAKIERLQDISDEDIMREGIRKESYAGGCMYFYNNTYIRKRKANVEPIYNTTPMRAFASLIYKVCGGKVWRDNPLVVAYSFELVD